MDFIIGFYRPKYKAKGGPHGTEIKGLEMQEWNVSTDIVQIVDENNGTICLVFMFTQEYLSVALRCFARAVTNCLLSSAVKEEKGLCFTF